MKIIFVIQRYGETIVGGGESYCRQIAEGLAKRGHDIHVATSTSNNYETWASHFPAGDSELNGVRVHRFDTLTRQENTFLYLTARAHGAAVLGHPLPAHVEDQWLRAVGPTMSTLAAWLTQQHDADVVVSVTYQYAHVLAVIEAYESCVMPPLAVVPLAHTDITLTLGVFDRLMKLGDAFLYLTNEEHELMHGRFGNLTESAHHAVLGAPVEYAGDLLGSEQELRRFPYCLAVGRLDASKGFRELAEAWGRIKRLRPDFPALLIAGSGSSMQSAPPGVELLGYVPDDELRQLYRGATALVHPSSFESFSLVCCEAWLNKTPIVVASDCDVLVGQSRRAQGGLWYASDAELAEIVETLTADQALRDRLGVNGYEYVRANYALVTVISRYEKELLDLSQTRA